MYYNIWKERERGNDSDSLILMERKRGVWLSGAKKMKKKKKIKIYGHRERDGCVWLSSIQAGATQIK